MKQVVKIILAAVAVAVLAVPAMAADKLIVKNATGGNAFKVDDAGTVTIRNAADTANVFYVNNAGQVGVGGNPTNAFDVIKEWASVDAANLTTAISVYKDAARYTFRRANGTLAVPTALANGDPIANLNWRGHTGSDWTAAGVAAISVNAEEAYTPTANAARLVFMTSPKQVAANPIERFRISSMGNVIAGNNGGLGSNVPIALTAVDGHFFIPTAAGAVTSCATMSTYPGHAPIWFDQTNLKICSCISGALKCATLL